MIDLGDGFAELAARSRSSSGRWRSTSRRPTSRPCPTAHIDVAFVNGAIRLDEQDHWAVLLRRKARTVVAFGACAHLGGVVGLGNLSEPETLLTTAYRRPADRLQPGAGAPGPAGAGRPATS